MKKAFTIELLGRGPSGSWTHLPIPFDVKEAFGPAARVAVQGTINGFAFRSTLTPEGGGKYYLMVNAKMCEGAKVEAGDLVSVVMEPDLEPRTVAVPPDLQAALVKARAAEIFAALAYSHRKEYVDWITAAKKAETRARRIEKCVATVLGKKRP